MRVFKRARGCRFTLKEKRFWGHWTEVWRLRWWIQGFLGLSLGQRRSGGNSRRQVKSLVKQGSPSVWRNAESWSCCLVGLWRLWSLQTYRIDASSSRATFNWALFHGFVQNWATTLSWVFLLQWGRGKGERVQKMHVQGLQLVNVGRTQTWRAGKREEMQGGRECLEE